MVGLQISLLPDKMAARTVAAWQYEQWGVGYPGMSFRDFLGDVERGIRSEHIPVILVGIVGGEVVGTASIIENDLPSRTDINPWLASVFVRPDFRNRGIGTALIEAAITHAGKLGIQRLHLFTHDLEEFYSRFGWMKIDRSDFMGLEVSIMAREMS